LNKNIKKLKNNQKQKKKMTEKAIQKGDALLSTHETAFHIRTTFFDQKIRTLFTRFDFDHNGKIEKEDFLNDGSVEYLELLHHMKDVFIKI